MNPYFHPMKKPDGGEWPALVERCAECRPGCVYIKHSGVVGDYFLPGEFATNDSCGCCARLGTTLSLECGNLLARERAIAWLQQNIPASLDMLETQVLSALIRGAPDEDYARLCHEVLDAKEKK